MSNHLPEEFDLEEQLLRVANREATRDELDRLNRALTESAELRSRACRFLAHDSLLRDWITESTQAAAIAKALPPKSGALQADPPRPAGRGLATLINQNGMLVAALAASLLAALMVNNLSLRGRVNQLYSTAVVAPGEPLPGVAIAPDPPKKFQLPDGREMVGRVAGLNGVVWTNKDDGLAFGDRVEQGKVIDIKSGVIELLLTTGAKVTVEGPALFEATSALESSLTQGRLAAAAPRGARGYTVLTPTSELVDIGTQFGVVVEQSGNSELHVFDGDVVARNRRGDSTDVLLHAKQNEAMRFDSTGAAPVRFAARERDFVRRITPLYREDELPPIPLTDGLSMWYAADRCGSPAVGDRVSNWRDLLIGENDFSDDAWQFEEGRRPAWVRDGAGRPAIRFNGWSTSLATSPMEPADQQTVFVACVPAPMSYANDHHGQMLYKYGDKPSLELSLMPDLTARGWVWPGPGSANVGAVRSKPVDAQQVTVIGYVYDSGTNRAELWVNGESQGSAEAPLAVHESGRRVLGSHMNLQFEAYFFGYMYEVAVYDTALSGDQMPAMWDYFGKRYPEADE
ncbi:FecR protein [Posidoniimonas polymericola]|uniref:FecR protein n=1 Tax=Posidoniimonas polymericola TaxID=2528002 RepID=A0A5C5YTM9_9BACT|nr:LamG domain-containing protein [Posidoniimonas polymericola]TWT78335.1 FecR protein [Posidoniimonas polymericola]